MADPNAVEDSSKRKDATSSKNGHKFTGLGDDSDVQIVEPSDPWEHLEEYLAKLTKEFPDLDPLVRVSCVRLIDRLIGWSLGWLIGLCQNLDSCNFFLTVTGSFFLFNGIRNDGNHTYFCV